jgi:hypothetical protein
VTTDPQASTERDNLGQRPAPPREANDLRVTRVITAGWAIALAVMLILSAVPGVVPAGRRWWIWTCVTGVAMGLFGLWYVPVLQRNRARAAARHACDDAKGAGDQASGPASGYTSRDSGSKTVSSTETPGSSTRS